jgi:hypothetical protein
MPPIIDAFAHLFVRSFFHVFAMLGTTWLGRLCDAAVVVLSVLYGFQKRGATKRDYVQVAIRSLKPMGTVFLFAFCLSFAVTTYDDHMALVNANISLRSGNDYLKHTNQTLKADRDEWKKKFDDEKNRSSLSSSALRGHVEEKAVPKVGPVTMTFFEYAGIHPDAPYCKKLVFASEVPAQSLGLRVHFGSPIKYVDSLVAFVYKGWQRIDDKDAKQVNIAMLGFNGDAISPERPVAIVVCSTENTIPLRVERTNVVESAQ